MSAEFDLIEQFKARQKILRPDCHLGIGDDCALLKVPSDRLLATSTDTLVAGIHFFSDCDPADIAYKALAVNLSDLAAMGAEPAWVSLSLTLPSIQSPWIDRFIDQFYDTATTYNLQLIGGDLSRGSLSLTLQIFGFVPAQQGLKRSGAKLGDRIYVTGTLGDASYGLSLLTSKSALCEQKHWLVNRLHRPTARVSVGQILRHFATSAIDISDGLAADLGHILMQSGCGADINVTQLPLSSALKNCLPVNACYPHALSGGDDYELCFTIPPEKVAEFELFQMELDCPCTCIGTITEGSSLVVLDDKGHPYSLRHQGYDHFEVR